jgi:membrane associated rhomboid family serine protease
MFLPLYPQGPIYHWPVATVVLIVANLVGFGLQMANHSTKYVEVTLPVSELQKDPRLALQFADADPNDEVNFTVEVEAWRDWALSHGDGLHPIQWLTSNFMHADVGHLLGNMLFLYIFGMLVEGRAGSLTFGVLYLSMGIVKSALEQVLWLGTPTGVSLGASSAIYSTLVLAMVWMPKDEIKCLLFFMFRIFLFDLPALLFGLFYVLWDFGFALFSNFQMSTQLLHVGGAAVGLVAAVIGLKFNWLDTENGDLYSLFLEARGQELAPKPRKLTVLEKQAEQAEQKALQKKLNSIQRSIEMHLQAGNYQAAVAQYREWRKRDGSASWTEPQLRQLFTLAFRAKDWNPALDFGRIYLESFDQPFADQIRLALGKFLAIEQKQLRKAGKLLQAVDSSRLSPSQQTLLEQLLAHCQRNSSSDEIELD